MTKRELARFARSLDSALERPSDVGARGAALSLMHRLGLPVAPSFAITTDAWQAWRAGDGTMPAAVWQEVAQRLDELKPRPRDTTTELVVLSSPRDRPAEPPTGLGRQPGERVLMPGPEPAADELDDELRRAVEQAWLRHEKTNVSRDAGVAVVIQRRTVARGDDPHLLGRVVSRDPTTGSPHSMICVCCNTAGDHPAPDWSVTSRRDPPEPYEALENAVVLLESVLGDMCGIEFSVDGDELCLLDTFVPLRSGAAAIRVAVDMTDEALVDLPVGMRRIPLWALEQAQAPRFAPRQPLEVVARAQPIAPGAGVGSLALGVEEARERSKHGAVVLVVPAEASDQAVAETSPSAILLAGPSRRVLPPGSFARRPVICQVPDLVIDAERREVRTASGRVSRAGEIISVDGWLGVVAAGRARLVASAPEPELARVLRWADEYGQVPVVNVEPPGWRRVTTPAELDGDHEAAPLVDVSGAPDPAQRAGQLRKLVRAAVDAGIPEIGLVVPDPLGGWDPDPPPAPWRLIVASARLSWAAALLAARLQSQRPGSPAIEGREYREGSWATLPQIEPHRLQASADRVRRSRLLP